MNNPVLFQARWDVAGGAVQFCAAGAAGLLVMAYRSEAVCDFRRVAFHPLDSPLAIHPIWLRIRVIASLRPFDAVVWGILLVG